MSMYKNQCIINSMMLHSFDNNAAICQLTEVLKIRYHVRFCRSCFSTMVSFGYVLVFWFFFVFVLRVTNIIYQNLMLLNFHCQKRSFSVNTIFVIDEKHTQWNLDTKAKVFDESISCFMKCPCSCISWKALKEKFQSVSFP